MKRRKLWERILRGCYRYLMFFFVVAFVVTCSMSLFVSAMSETLHFKLTEENLNTAAKLTFGNVILLSVLFTVIDFLRRKFTTERITKRIAEAAKRVVQGEFHVRIAPLGTFAADESINEIVDCFNRMTEELEGVELLRSDFIANVSHEMKTPLAIIQNYGTLLQASELEEEKRLAYARGITDSTHRLADMVTNVLKLNRLEKQQIFPNAELYDLGEQLCECLLAYEAVWERKKIELEIQIEDEVMVTTDKELLALVWNNLFSNALKFTPEEGTVSVKLETDGEYAAVRVSDTGCGISPEVGKHIFEKFYQGDTSHQTHGNGLGLALVKRVVDILHGEISVESTVGKGSTFLVKFRRN